MIPYDVRENPSKLRQISHKYITFHVIDTELILLALSTTRKANPKKGDRLRSHQDGVFFSNKLHCCLVFVILSTL